MVLPQSGIIDERNNALYQGTGGQPSSSQAIANPVSDVASGTAPMTGFASQYTPAQAGIFYQSPWALLNSVFPGINPTTPGYQALRDFGADPLTLHTIMAGSNRAIPQDSAGDFINFLNELYSNLGSVGGQALSASELLNTIFTAAGRPADPEGQGMSSLQNVLLAGDQGQQVRTLFNMLRDVSNATMNPLAATGYQAALARAGDVYQNQIAQANAGSAADQTFGQWLSQNAPSLAGR